MHQHNIQQQSLVYSIIYSINNILQFTNIMDPLQRTPANKINQSPQHNTQQHQSLMPQIKLLFNSRRDHTQQLLTSKLQPSPQTIKDISPQKYGRAAFAQLTYTPSRLADNVIFRQAHSMRKIQQKVSHIRQIQALNHLLSSRLSNLSQEKETIEVTLNARIEMYKRINKSMEQSNATRITQLQRIFNLEKATFIADKQQEARFVQAQQELLQQRIGQLQAQLSRVHKLLQEKSGEHGDLGKQHQILQKNYEANQIDNQRLSQNLAREKEVRQQETQQLQRKLFTQQVQKNAQLQRHQLQHQKHIAQIQQQHQQEQKRRDNLFEDDMARQKQEMREVRETFAATTKRLDQTLKGKQTQLDNTHHQLQLTQQKLRQRIIDFTSQIAHLTNKNETVGSINSKLQAQAVRVQQQFRQREKALSNTIRTLQNQLSVAKQRILSTQEMLQEQRSVHGLMVSDLRHQLISQQQSREGVFFLRQQNGILLTEIDKLKEVLGQSSIEMDRCKQQFIKMGREKDKLLGRIRQYQLQIREYQLQSTNNARKRIQAEEQMQVWRDKYYAIRR